MQSILLVPLLPVHESLDRLKDSLGSTFRLPVVLGNGRALNPERAFDASRNQYFSSILLSLLLERFEGHSGKILAVTSSDLFVPVLTFVFGEAQLDGKAAVISSHRLKEEFYGMPADEGLFQKRFTKEAVHELGHTFGLVHCRNFDCVMHSSTAVEEIDVKGEEFCAVCSRMLRQRTASGQPQ